MNGVNNKSGKSICCKVFQSAVDDLEIVDYHKFQERFEDTYEALDGWYVSDEIGNLMYPKLVFCPWCGKSLVD